LELSRRHGAVLQLGGSDQWGNIINGVELGRKVDGKLLFGLTAPLITTSDGKKMGKSAAGAVWLKKELLSEYEYWQFWRNTNDADVIRFLKVRPPRPPTHLPFPPGPAPAPSRRLVELARHAVLARSHHNPTHSTAPLTTPHHTTPNQLFTELPLPQIEELAKLEGADINKAKVVLADEATKMLHGEACLAEIHATVANLFSGSAASSSTAGAAV
jgi:tyrosyl-tRNA synthetase